MEPDAQTGNDLNPMEGTMPATQEEPQRLGLLREGVTGKRPR